MISSKDDVVEVTMDDPHLLLIMFFFNLLDCKEVHWGIVHHELNKALDRYKKFKTDLSEPATLMNTLHTRTCIEFAKKLVNPDEG